jgi:hypothetical protein
VEIDRVDFGSRQRDRPLSWLCYVTDPQADNLIAELTLKSAVDHFNGIDPGGFLANAGKPLAVHVHEIETSDEASIVLQGNDGQDVLYSPWQRNQVFVRELHVSAVLVVSARLGALMEGQCDAVEDGPLENVGGGVQSAPPTSTRRYSWAARSRRIPWR